MHPEVEAFYAGQAAAFAIQGAFNKSRARALGFICFCYEEIKCDPGHTKLTIERRDELCTAVALLDGLRLPGEFQVFLLRDAAPAKSPRKAGRPKSEPDQMDQVLLLYFVLHSALKDKVWKVTKNDRASLSPRQHAAEKAQDVCKNLHPNRRRPRWDASTLIKKASSPRGKAIKAFLARTSFSFSEANIQEILKIVTKKN